MGIFSVESGLAGCITARRYAQARSLLSHSVRPSVSPVTFLYCIHPGGWR